MKRILCLWLPSWPMQRLLVARPELSKRAIVLHARGARRGRRVVCCSAAAEASGVRVDMPLVEATALAEKISLAQKGKGKPDQSSSERLVKASALHLEEHDPLNDRQVLEQLAAWSEQFSPVVGLETVDQPSCLLMDVTGLGTLFGGEEALVRDMHQAFGQRDYTVRIAISNTIGAAWAVAHDGLPMADGGLPIADGGLPMADGGLPMADGGLRIVKSIAGHSCQSAICDPQSAIVDTLRPLPVQALRLPRQVVELLQQLGIFTIGQLATLPRASLSSRFGDQLLRRWDQATGAVQEVIVAHRPPPPLEAQWALEHPTVQREVINSALAHLTEHLVQLLGQRNRGAIELLCQLDCVHGRPTRIEVGLFRPTASAQHLTELIHMQLTQRTVPGPVHRVSIRATKTAPLADRQHQLLGNLSCDNSRELTRLVDRLSSRLGRDGVVGAKLRADAQMECAYCYVPLTGQRSLGSRGAASARSRSTIGSGQRPLWLCTPPLPIDVIAIVPQDPPISFVHQSQQHRIAQYWGPERIETGWWRGRSVRRDYYRVEDQRGNRFWLFRRLSDGKWFLHGFFE